MAQYELRNHPELCSELLYAIHRLHPISGDKIFASRMFSVDVFDPAETRADVPLYTQTPLLPSFEFDLKVPDFLDPCWVAMFSSDNRSCESGGHLVQSVVKHVHLLMTMCNTRSRFKFTYHRGDGEALNLEEVINHRNRAPHDRGGISKNGAAWSANMVGYLRTCIQSLGFEGFGFGDQDRNYIVKVPDDKGYFFLFAWSECGFDTVCEVVGDVLCRMGVVSRPCFQGCFAMELMERGAFLPGSDSDGTPTPKGPKPAGLFC
jgi:hypothetical protein